MLDPFLNRASMSMLQWDRAFDGAEIWRLTGSELKGNMLQWDRAFDGAEMVRSLTCVGSRRFGRECERLF